MSKKFSFRLQKVLDIRVKDEEEVKIRFSEIQSRKIKIEDKLKTLKSDYDRYSRQGICENIVNQKITINYLGALNNTIRDISSEFNKACEELENLKSELINRQVERKSLEKLKEQKYTEFLKEEDMKEQIINDEFAIISFARKQQVS
jgi:flagellar protein FliJ